MKAAVDEIIVNKPFDRVLEEARNKIITTGFLLIHEIDTQQILKMQAINILPLRQLLFFHPQYMKKILENDPLAVAEVPLKLVLREIDAAKTSVTYVNPLVNLQDYKLDDSLAKELLKIVKAILNDLMA